MKIFTAKQIHEWDAYSITHEPIASIDLMERAAQTCVQALQQSLSKTEGKAFYIFCGRGNNGGDGLAMARMLYIQQAKVNVYILGSNKKGSQDFETNLSRWKNLGQTVTYLDVEKDIPAIPAQSIVVDALFGSGLNKPLSGIAATVALSINHSPATVYSIDIPSGMFMDEFHAENIMVRADVTFTFQAMKYCFFLTENAPYFGKVSVLDIGLNKKFIDEQSSSLEYTTEETISQIYRPRGDFGHKGTYGHALLIAGSTGKMGAAVMAARSCLRAGVGLLTCLIPSSEHIILPIAIPEAMTAFREVENSFQKYAAVGIGPGLGTEEAELLIKTLSESRQATVIDADALNMLSRIEHWEEKVPDNSILTPHPKEFDRLFGISPDEDSRIKKALETTARYPFAIVLKGHYSLIASDGKGWFNATGNSGLATGGSGDTLTGILLSLLAQKYTAKDAAVLGTYLHGLAADLALLRESKESLLPTDLDQYLGAAFKTVQKYIS